MGKIEKQARPLSYMTDPSLEEEIIRQDDTIKRLDAFERHIAAMLEMKLIQLLSPGTTRDLRKHIETSALNFEGRVAAMFEDGRASVQAFLDRLTTERDERIADKEEAEEAEQGRAAWWTFRP